MRRKIILRRYIESFNTVYVDLIVQVKPAQVAHNKNKNHSLEKTTTTKTTKFRHL